MEIKHIDFTKNRFTANGKEYFIKYPLTINRFQEFEKLQNHFAFGLDFSNIVESLTKSIEFANKGKGVEAWNVIFNLKEGIAYRLENRHHPALMLCSLFIVTEGEDFSIWDDELANQKISDWTKEGIDINDFFELASNFVKDFIKTYKEISQNILNMNLPEKLKPTGKKSSS